MRGYSPFSILLQQAARFRQIAPDVESIDMVSWRPGGVARDEAAACLSKTAAYGYRKVLSALETLDAATPLVRDEPNGVRETLRLYGTTERLYLQVDNALGERERITRWYAVGGFEDYFDGWCETRRLSDDFGDAWDLSRRERRVVDYEGSKVLIDPGIVLAVDAIVAMGCETHHSCEGHPGRGYVAYSGEGRSAVNQVMRASGWRIEPEERDTIARMPRSICTVQARDRLLRVTAEMLLREVPHLAPSNQVMTW